MLSISALLEIYSGDVTVPIKQSEHMINLNTKYPMTPSVLTPHCIKTALATKRQNALSNGGSGWICSVCSKYQATNMCSSIVAYPNITEGRLNVTEKIFLACPQSRCIDNARSTRNKIAKNAGTGVGFRLAFRCANELIVDLRDEKGCKRE